MLSIVVEVSSFVGSQAIEPIVKVGRWLFPLLLGLGLQWSMFLV
jgi:hypothetical protein